MIKNWSYRSLQLKRRIEGLIIFPFILAGRIISRFRPLPKQYRVFFFFPFYHTGGAEKVHAQIAGATGGEDCILFFTRKSQNDQFLKSFERTGCTIKDISRYTDNKGMYFLNLVFRGLISGYINRQPIRPLVFNGQSNFGYKLSPWIKKSIAQIELIHSFNSFSYIRMPFLPFITRTVIISRKRIEDHRAFYRKTGVPSRFEERLQYIPNGIPLPHTLSPKPEDRFTILFAGRGGPEKRIPLIAEMAARLHKLEHPARFEIAGEVSDVLEASAYPFIRFHGNISDEDRLRQLYQQAAVVIITSSTEGFPLVVMEGMAYGCAIIATPVGDIPYHVQGGVNGFLFSDTDDEKRIVEEGVRFIKELYGNGALWRKMSENNISYAQQHFDLQRLNNAYQELFNSLKQMG